MKLSVSVGIFNEDASQERRAVPSSSNLPLVQERGASGELRTLFEQYRERFARNELPGIVLCFATNPSLLKGMMQIAEGLLFGETLLTARHKEMIATYISLRNSCPYCAASHAALLRAQGAPPEVVCALQQEDLDAQLFTSAEHALLKFTGKINAESAAVTRADVEAVISAGWTEPQVMEAVHIAALFAAFNRIANGFGLPSPYPDASQANL